MEPCRHDGRSQGSLIIGLSHSLQEAGMDKIMTTFCFLLAVMTSVGSSAISIDADTIITILAFTK